MSKEKVSFAGSLVEKFMQGEIAIDTDSSDFHKDFDIVLLKSSPESFELFLKKLLEKDKDYITRREANGEYLLKNLFSGPAQTEGRLEKIRILANNGVTLDNKEKGGAQADSLIVNFIESWEKWPVQKEYYQALDELLLRGMFNTRDIEEKKSTERRDLIDAMKAVQMGSDQRDSFQWILAFWGKDIKEYHRAPNDLDKDLRNKFHLACMNGSLKDLKKCTAAGINPNVRDSEGKMPLFYAVTAGTLEMVQELYDYQVTINRQMKLERAVDILNQSDKDGQGLLHHAMGAKVNKNIVEFLLEQKFNLGLADKEGQTPIFLALKNNRLDLAELLLEKGADINHPDKKGNTVLHEAAKQGNKEVIEFLLKHNINLNAKNNEGKIARDLTDLDIKPDIKLILENANSSKIAELKQQNVQQTVPKISFAGSLVKSFTSILPGFITKPMIARSSEETKKQILVSSVARGDKKIFDFLKKQAGKMDLMAEKGETLLHLAVRYKNSDMVADLLFGDNKVSDILATDKKGVTALEYAYQAVEEQKIYRGKMSKGKLKQKEINNKKEKKILENLIKKFLGEETTIDTKSENFDKAFDIILLKSSPEIFKQFLEKLLKKDESYIERRERKGKYILSDIFFNEHGVDGRSEKIRVLADRGINLDRQSLFMNLVTSFNTWRISELHKTMHDLLSRGVRVYKNIMDIMSDDYHYLRTDEARERGCGEVLGFWGVEGFSPEIVKNDGGASRFIVEKFGNSLYKAAVEGNLENLKECMAKRMNPNIKHKEGKMPICYAVINGNTEMVKELYNYQVKINKEKNIEKNIDILNQRDDTSQGLLHYAVDAKGKSEIVEFLLEQKPKLDLEDKQGKTPIFVALKNNRLDMAELLLRKGADINHPDRDDNTVLHEAVKQGNREAIEFLLKQNINLELKNNEGKTAYELVDHDKYPEIAQMLIDERRERVVNGKIPAIGALFQTVEKGDLGLLRELFAQNVNVDQRDHNGNTLLHLAIVGEKREIIDFLREKHASPDIKNNEGETCVSLLEKKNISHNDSKEKLKPGLRSKNLGPDATPEVKEKDKKEKDKNKSQKSNKEAIIR